MTKKLTRAKSLSVIAEIAEPGPSGPCSLGKGSAPVLETALTPISECPTTHEALMTRVMDFQGWLRTSSKMSASHRLRVENEFRVVMEYCSRLEAETRVFMTAQQEQNAGVLARLDAIEKKMVGETGVQSSSKPPEGKPKQAKADASRKPGETYASRVKASHPALRLPAKKPTGTTERVRATTVMVYPATPELTTSSSTRKALTTGITPSSLGVRVKSLRDGPRAGVVLELEGGDALARLQAKLPATLRAELPRKRLPRVIAFDTPEGVTVEHIREGLQHLAEGGAEMGSALAETRICFTTRHGRVRNTVLEVHPLVRQRILEAGRIYIGWSSCRVKDHLASTRCYKCQAHGHIAKVCKQVSPVCSHCAESGHVFSECSKKDVAPVCAACKAVKRPNTHHDVRSPDCPMRVKAVSRLISRTDYGP